jgi:hypothetical protein
MHNCTLMSIFVSAVLLCVAHTHELAVQTGGLGTYEYMAPEVLAHQRYSEKVRLELNRPSQALTQMLYVLATVAWLHWRCSTFKH